MLILLTCSCHTNQIYFVDEDNICRYVCGGDGNEYGTMPGSLTNVGKGMYKEITDITDIIKAILT